MPGRLDHLNVGSFLTLRAIALGKAHTLVLSEAFEAIGSNVLEMDKQIIATCIRGNEAEAFGVVEPFDDTGLAAHIFSFSFGRV
jgi:hypothetical protein